MERWEGLTRVDGGGGGGGDSLGHMYSVIMCGWVVVVCVLGGCVPRLLGWCNFGVEQS